MDTTIFLLAASLAAFMGFYLGFASVSRGRFFRRPVALYLLGTSPFIILAASVVAADSSHWIAGVIIGGVSLFVTPNVGRWFFYATKPKL